MATQILASDIELRASERMTDADDGGGEMSAVTIIDNKINQLFGPISDSDRVAGRVNLRQAYMHVATANADVFLGANAILDSPPSDPAVTSLLFTLGKSGASRADAQAYIENYIAIGPRSRMHPVGTQNAGQGQILAYQLPSTPLPEVGDVYVLSIEGTATTQAFKIQAISSYDTTFAYSNGGSVANFTCTVVTLTLTQALTQTFPGSDPSPLMTGASWIRTSLVSDIANYYGIAKLTADVPQGSIAFTVDSPQGQLLPVTTTEIPVLDTPPGSVTSTISAGSRNVTVTNFGHNRADPVTQINRILNWTATLRPIPTSGTLTVSYRTGGKWYTLTEDGTGAITGASPSFGSGSLSTLTGTALVTLGDLPDIGSAIIWTWGSGVHYKERLDATLQPPTSYVSLGESVDAGTLVVTYLKSGTPTNATTDSDGLITGADVSGHVVQATGEVRLEWTTFPDPNSNLLFAYDHTDQFTEIQSSGSFTLAHTPVKSGSVNMKWSADLTQTDAAITYTCADFYGSQTDCVASKVTAKTTKGSINYDVSDAAGNIGSFGSINYATGVCSLTLTSNITTPVYVGEVTGGDSAWFDTSVAVSNPSSIKVNYCLDTANPTSRTATVALPPMSIAFCSTLTADTIVPESIAFTWNGYEYRDSLGNGEIYRHTTPWTTQSGELAGAIDYNSRIVSLNLYASGNGAITVLSCLTQYGDWPSIFIYGRTPGSPVSPGTFYIRGTTIDGREISGQSDLSGNINAAEIQGNINQDMGIFYLQFGMRLLASTLTDEQKSEAWYNANNIDGSGYIWKPTFVINSTLRMNCVVTSTIPLSATELGLDPVRLPSTGRVPIFKTGYRLVIHDTQFVTLPNPAVAGATINCGRNKISRVRMEDALGRRVPDSCMYAGQYVQFSSLTSDQQATYSWWEIRDDGTVWLPSTMDLDAGLVELSSPLVLTGFTQPLKLYHTIEDAVLVTSVDLSGYITINRALTHAYTAANSKVSSQLFYGDMWARYTNLFSQLTWTGVWQDSIIGSATAGQYNDTLYPIIVTNDGVIDEKWMLQFTSATVFNVYGERSGQIATGNINTDCAPANPAANGPYFFIDHRGWGLGWVAGNVVRFDTVWPGALWVARCISPSIATGTADTIGLAFRGDSAPA